jgi:hypothetical protein
MEAASPARLYAAVAGAFLLLLGIAGFFYSASFGAPGDVEKVLGAFEANAWTNLLYVLVGSLGLLAGGISSRRYALVAGALLTVLAIWGFTIDAGDAILGFLPASGADDTLRLVFGLLGLAAAAATPKRALLEARAQAAG